MAKAAEIPDLGEDDAYALAAAKVVSVRAQELRDHSAGVLDTTDIERVHDMRVATRRLRAALEVFEPCFPKKRHRAVLQEVKELADALGERRDRDVTIAHLTEFSSAISRPDRPGVLSLVHRLEREQAEANEALKPYVADDRLEALDTRLGELVEAARELTPDDEDRYP